jgi:hypothetical protein
VLTIEASIGVAGRMEDAPSNKKLCIVVKMTRVGSYHSIPLLVLLVLLLLLMMLLLLLLLMLLLIVKITVATCPLR